MTSRLVEVCPGAWVATSRRYATTSTALLDGQGGAVVVDPAWDPDELAAIPSDLAALGVRCVAGLATHEHYDHVMWHPGLGDVPRFATRGTSTRLAGHRDELPWAGPRAECVVHHAHAPDHLALLVEQHGLLLCGDMLSDVELPMPTRQDATLDGYLAGLDRLRDVVGRARLLVPGHGSVTDAPLARFDADMRYLDDLLADRPSDDPRVLDPENASLHADNLRRARTTR